MSNLDSILSFLTGKGLTPAQAAGVAGNLQVESGFNPAAYNAGEGAIGLAQWENGRRTNLQRYAAATGGTETDLATQLGFLWSELTGPESSALANLRATSDPSSAAAVFDQYYERSAGTSRGARIADAQKIAGGDLSAGASSSSSGSTGGLSVQDAGYKAPTGMAGTAYMVALKAVGALAAAGLVIVGAMNTVKS